LAAAPSIQFNSYDDAADDRATRSWPKIRLLIPLLERAN